MFTDVMMTVIGSVSSGLAVFCLAFLIFDLMQKIEVEKTEMTDEYKRIPIFFRMFMPLTNNVMPLLKNEAMQKMVQSAQKKLGMAGYELAMSGEQFVALRILFLIFGVLIAILLILGQQASSGIIFLLIMAVYPNVWLNRIIRMRHLEILKALPNVLDLLTLSVEAGRDFLTALRDIVMRRKLDAIGEELRRALHEIQLGKTRQEALHEMSLRVNQPELTTVLNSVIQADELGVSIGQLLRVQGDQLRAKRFARAEKLANESPVKILFPIIIFIFPAVFIVLMGPLMSQALKSFGN